MKIRLIYPTRLMALLILCFTVTASAQTTNIIYRDSFTRTGLLNGTAPDVVNTGGAVWMSATNNFCDGSEVVHNSGADHPAFLPLSVVAGHIYTLSVDLNPTNTDTEWLSMGFASSTNMSAGWGADAAAWMLQRGNRTEVQTFGTGYSGVSSGLPGGNPTGYTTFSIVLDTSAAQWVATYYENGVQVGSSQAFVTNPTVVAVGFGGDDPGAGTIDNFILTDVNLGTCVSPTFTVPPSPGFMTCYSNASYTLSPVVNGSLPIYYQWQLSGTNIGGATNLTLTVSNLHLAVNGSYSLQLTVSNACGTVTSDPVSIQVVSNPPDAYTIYQDSFSGTNALNGRAPDVADTGNATWYAGPNYVLNGNGQVVNPGHQQAFLPFVPKWGHVYVFTVDMNPTSGNWLAAAYTVGNNVAAPNMYDVAGPAWLLQRPPGAGDVQTFAYGFDGSTSGLPSFNPSSGFTTFSIVLDTTTGDTNANTGWTIIYVQDGVVMSQSVYGNTLADANPVFNNIAIGGEAASSGLFRNLRLSDSIVPPATVTILSAPQPVDTYTNGKASFSISATGGQPITYQWRFHGTNLPNATNSTLALTNIQASQGGTYVVVVSNSQGSVTNSNAVLTVLPDPIEGTVIYQDSFAGNGPLAGRQPDVADLPGEAWVAPDGISTTNGVLDYETGGGTGSSAFLPFTPEWGHVYVLSVDMNVLSGNWLALGFTSANLTGSSLYNSGAQEWLLLQPDHSIQLFTNDLAGNFTFPDVAAAGVNTLKLVLDTTTGDVGSNVGWTLRYLLGRNILNTTVFTGGNPNTAFVGIGAELATSGTYGNLRLTDNISNTVTLSLTGTGNALTLSWPQGVLLETTNLASGQWTTNGAASPYTFNPSGQQKFFRVKVQ